MIGQCVCSDVVRLDERGIKQIAQRDRVARLESNIIRVGSNKSRFRNHGDLRKIAGAGRGPIEYDHRGRDLGQAADLTLFVRLRFIENVTRGRIDCDIRLRAFGARNAGEQQAKSGDDERKIADGNDHSALNSLHLIWRPSNGNRQCAMTMKMRQRSEV